MCAYAGLSPSLCEIQDLTASIFFDHPDVISAPHYRFYCGQPIQVLGDQGNMVSIGVLGVVDFKPRKMGGHQKELFRVLGRQIVAQLELRRQIKTVKSQVDELKDYQEMLTATTEQVNQASQAKARFIANTSHEIRTPLNAILGFAQILDIERESGRLNPNAVHCVDRIMQGGRNLCDVINNVLDFSKIEAGKMPIRCEYIDFRSWASTVLKKHIQTAQAKGTRFCFDIDKQVPMSVETDPEKFAQIINNCVGCVLRINPAPKCIRLTISALHSNVCPSRSVTLLLDLMVSEHQNPDNHFDSGGAIGTGFLISKTVVEALGGQLTVHHEAGSSISVSIRLPVSTALSNATIDVCRSTEI
eukprot:TRINITY_DN12040_c0_g1_i1.p1 TRINITY_DN12040_c0_g1~~TRINITY_DN12040_c0_g1_i1.p1  ORF type:complete len:359 (+),score=11.09 TRINITY_DN12040_c0_g1_i1:256-1332(+)